MWIRSQDKRKLLKVNSIILENPLNNGETWIRGYFEKNQYAMLGYYKSEERALEVLDEMQSYLENNYLSISDIPQHNNNPWIDYCPRYITRTTKTVYQMPEV